jgi:hypothetical protein
LGIRRRKLPYDLRFPIVSVIFPSGYLLFYGVHVGNAPIETLPIEDAQFYLGYVEPTAMLGCIVDLKPFGKSTGFFWRERLIQRCCGVGIQVIFKNDK